MKIENKMATTEEKLNTSRIERLRKAVKRAIDTGRIVPHNKMINDWYVK